MKGRKGQLWTEWISGIIILFIVTTLYIILNQVYDAELYPEAIEDGVDATNLSIIDLGWKIFLIPVLLSVTLGVVAVGRKQSRGGGYAP